jgi:hypothetical protein
MCSNLPKPNEKITQLLQILQRKNLYISYQAKTKNGNGV